MRNEGGFTLLELLTTITIVAILAALALPSFGYLGANTKVKSASTDFYLSMLRARSEAVKRNVVVSLGAKSGNWGNGWAVYVDTNGNGAYDDAATDKLIYDVTIIDPNLVSASRPRALNVEACSAINSCTSTPVATNLQYLASGRILGSWRPAFRVKSTKVDSVTRCLVVDLTGRPAVLKKGEPTGASVQCS